MQTLEEQIQDVTKTLKKAYPYDSICLEIEDWIHITKTENLMVRVWDSYAGEHSPEFHTFDELLAHVAKKEHSNEILFRRFQ